MSFHPRNETIGGVALRRHDAVSFFEADPEDLLVGMMGEEPVATVSVVRHGATFGLLGLHSVREPWRARGYGLRIGKAGMAHFAGRNRWRGTTTWSRASRPRACTGRRPPVPLHRVFGFATVELA